MAYRDYYNILGVPKRATQQEIKQAYRDLARKWHPDRHPGNDQVESKFKDINEAYNTLGDAEKRARYDRLGPLYTESGRPPRPDEVNAAFGTMVGSLFRRKKKAQQGSDLRYTLSIDLEDALAGTEREIRVPRKQRCKTCQGDGAEPEIGKVTCDACQGSGFSKTSRLFKTSCYHCSGQGFRVAESCGTCNGDGTIGFEDTLKVTVPPGVATGQKLRLAEKGDAPRGTGVVGDLFVIISVREHSLFRRRGQDLITDLPLTFAEITNGTEVDVPTLSGKTAIKIPAGTQSGQVFRLSGKGLPSATSRGRGDLHLTVQMEVPKELSAAQKNKLQQWFDGLDQQNHPQRAAYQAALRERQ